MSVDYIIEKIANAFIESWDTIDSGTLGIVTGFEFPDGDLISIEVRGSEVCERDSVSYLTENAKENVDSIAQKIAKIAGCKYDGCFKSDIDNVHKVITAAILTSYLPKLVAPAYIERTKEIKGDKQYPVVSISRELNLLGWKRGDRVKIGIRKGLNGMEIVIRKISD